MRHRTEKYKEKVTRKGGNKERIMDVKTNALDATYVHKEQQKKILQGLSG